MIIKHNKSKYIRKYDYLRSFYLPEDEWFISTNTLASAIEKLGNSQQKDLWVEDEDDAESNEHEIDAYSFYKETKEEESIPKKEEVDPRIIEGNIIDKQSREFIKNYFDLESYDFSSDTSIKTHEEAFEATKKRLNERNIILFQPTFIYDGLITKPDALVIKDGKAILVEVKGTSNPKINHIFDLYFQFNVINPTIKLTKCLLCLIKYEPLKTNGISFVLNERGSFSKTGFSVPEKYKDDNPFDAYSIQLIAQFKNASDTEYFYSDPCLNFINLFTDNPIDDEYIKGIKRAPKGLNFVKKNMNKEAFDEKIQALKQYQPNDNVPPRFVPCEQYKSDLKDADNWKAIREFWFNTNYYYGTQFSGNLISYDNALLLNKKQYNSLDEFINVVKSADKIKGGMKTFISYLFNKSSCITQIHENGNVIAAYNPEGIKKYFTTFLDKKKKVYFDFESINTAIRVTDKTLPFMQAVNQVSVCYDVGNGTLESTESLVIDPKNGLTTKSYKQIIDRILPPTNETDLEKKYEYWKQFKYIVYNKGFECTRLREMKYLINEKEYNKKVEIINNNIVDLADLFTIRQNNNCFIVFKELKGFYSIKKVLPIVMKYDKPAFLKAKCRDYHELHVRNGSMAQSLSTRRFFNQIKSDEEWKKHTDNLKVYCDNDVRAMAAVEYFIQDILDNKVKF